MSLSKNRPINVLSLFDGISAARQGLEKNNQKIENYYCSEIDKWAIGISKYNFPSNIQIGDVRDVDLSKLGKIDLVAFGSPCQNLSITVINNIKHNQGLEGEKSSLFYIGYDILQKVKPKYFLYENVASMRQKDRDVITESLGVEPIMICSSNFTAQDRKRLFWTNIPIGELPIASDKVLKDIVLDSSEVADKYWYDKPHTYNGDDKKVQATVHVSGHDILKRVYNLNDKCATLTCCRGGNTQKKVYQDEKCRKLTPLEYERLQTMADNFTQYGEIDGKVKKISDSQRWNCLGNSWTVDVIVFLLKEMKFDV